MAATEATEQNVGDTGGWNGAGRAAKWADATSSSEEVGPEGGADATLSSEGEEKAKAEPNYSWGKAGWDNHNWSQSAAGSGPAEAASGGWNGRSDWSNWSPSGGSGGTGAAGSSSEPWTPARQPWYRPGNGGPLQCRSCHDRWAPCQCKFGMCLGCCPKQQAGVSCLRHMF